MNCHARCLQVALMVCCLGIHPGVCGVSAAPIYQVSTNGARTSGPSTPDDWTPGNCYGTIGGAIAAMSAGEAVIVNDGSYYGTANFIDDMPGGTSRTVATTIRARHALEVTIKNSGSLGYYDHPIEVTDRYIRVDGFIVVLADTTYPPAIVELSGSHNVVKNCIAIRKGVMDNYGSWFSVGGVSNLVEDCAGAGHARYGFVCGSATAATSHNVFRRCVGRADYSDSDQPMATFCFYGNNSGDQAEYMAFQNCIAIDGNQCDTGYGLYAYIWGGFYFPKNTDHAVLRGCLVVHVDNAYGGYAVKELGGHDLTMSDCVSWDNANSKGGSSGGLWMSGSQGNIDIRHCTFGDSDCGMRNNSSGTNQHITDCLFTDNASIGTVGLWASQTYNGFNPGAQAFGTLYVTSSHSPAYMVRIEDGSDYDNAGSSGGDIGATILKRHGADGAAWGDPGWDTLSDVNLWPYPNEEKIRALFREANPPNAGSVPTTNDTTRGFCSDGQTLTKYVWEYLGRTIPPDIYGGAAALVITTASLPMGNVHAAYSQTLSATGGTAPYTWGTNGGSLPPELNLDPVTGTISGTPTNAGVFNVSVRVTDASLSNATKSLSITINGPDVTPPVLSAISGVSIGTTATIGWTTDEPANSQVQYGRTAWYTTQSVVNAAAVTSHNVVLSDLDPLVTYHFRVKSADGADNLAVSSDRTFSAPVPHEAIAVGETWKYFKGAADPGATWAGLQYDDSGWLQGPTGIGYGDGDDVTVLSDMQGNYVTVYARKMFVVSNAASVSDMTLTMDFDDGFVAYLNGLEVCRTNIVGTPTRNTTASTYHEAGTPVSFDISASLGLLVNGMNVLAIEVHNDEIDSSDLSMIPNLTLTVTGGDADTDADGLPDDWETRYFDQPTNCVPGADADEDGFNNTEEFIADTNPTNRTSFFRIAEGASWVPFEATVVSSTGRLYRLGRRLDLTGGDGWIAVGVMVEGTGMILSLPDTQNVLRAFYRVDVSLP
ncbi:MAG: putative Ig domain-containing protein [bacterium]